MLPLTCSDVIADRRLAMELVSGVKAGPQVVFMSPGSDTLEKSRSDAFNGGGREPTHPRHVWDVHVCTGWAVVVHPVWRVFVQG